MELTKERMLEIAKSQKRCDFCFTAEPCSDCKNSHFITLEELWEFYDRVIDLLQADADGRLVVLPVRVGERCSVKRIAEETTIVDGILKYATLVVETDKENMLMHPCNVFADRDEAEATLEKMGGGEG